VRALVRAGFVATPERTPAALLAELLPRYGALLAGRAESGVGREDWTPLALARRHPAEEVRLAAGLAYERLLGRLRELGDGEHALALLADLADSGLDVRAVHYQRARMAFYPVGSARMAREAARAMRGAADGSGRVEDRLWLLRSLLLEAAAELGLGEVASGEEGIERASAVLAGLLEERRDLGSEGPAPAHVEALAIGTLLDVYRVVALLLRGNETVHSATALLREAHKDLLDAQLGVARAGGSAYSTWDSILDSELSPFRLLFAGKTLEGLDVSRSLDVQMRLGRLLATVVPEEFPGFEAFPESDHAREDPRRGGLLLEILTARVQDLSRMIEELRRKIVDRQVTAPDLLPEPQDLQRLQSLRWRRSEARRALEDPEGEGARALRELRVPASLALWLARDLRSEGRTVEARRYAVRMREDLEREGILHGFFWGLELLAEIEMAIGSSWIDESEPRKAETELLKAVERLRSIEKRFEENGAGPRQTAGVRAQRCSALVSLAVNANVKLRDPEKALEYYERAYALRQDEFMKVLLACYRARSGRVEEARLLLREIEPGPQTYYNLACTHALLGDRPRALKFLELELAENQFSRGSLQRQKEWAREDPDLAALRGDPGFERLVAGD
jgi:tetratricopeptide (TPR) repeat protein